MGTRPLSAHLRPSGRGELAAGWAAMLPFWLAALPAALAYVIAARQVGLSFTETLLFSLLAFSGPAQITAVGLLAEGTAGSLVALVVAAQSVHLLIFGMELTQRVAFGWAGRLLAAFLLTDAAWAVSTARRQLTPAFYVGAGLSMYSAWALGTTLSLALGAWLPLLSTLDVRSVSPLAFAALLTPLLRAPADLIAALVAGGLAIVCSDILPAALALPAAAAAGSVLGWLASRSAGRVRR